MAGRPLPRSPGQERTCGVTIPPDVSFGYFGAGISMHSKARINPADREHFQFEKLCISNHTTCHFAEKTRFSTRSGPGDAVPPPRVLLLSKAERSEKHTPAGILD